ncbi:hypothetical protein WH91_17590 [Devosia psychrophila]|uniref:Uncharacterized protein n=1 Tax=Devosia psychrophila TaxID=728005 RepID=A0ABR5DUZ4_9HYPH|nr:hypothetical protein WH91_17590 [Devosia psychrophila]
MVAAPMVALPAETAPPSGRAWAWARLPKLVATSAVEASNALTLALWEMPLETARWVMFIAL